MLAGVPQYSLAAFEHLGEELVRLLQIASDGLRLLQIAPRRLRAHRRGAGEIASDCFGWPQMASGDCFRWRFGLPLIACEWLPAATDGGLPSLTSLSLIHRCDASCAPPSCSPSLSVKSLNTRRVPCILPPTSHRPPTISPPYPTTPHLLLHLSIASPSLSIPSPSLSIPSIPAS